VVRGRNLEFDHFLRQLRSTLCLDRDVPEVRWSLSDDRLLVTVPTGEQREVEKLTGALGYAYLRCTYHSDLDRWLRE
jgi:hypothetical protein